MGIRWIGGLGKQGRIERVVGIGDDDGDVQFPDGALLGHARDADGELGDDMVVRVEHLELALLQPDHELGGGAADEDVLHRRNDDLDPGKNPIPVHPGIELFDELGVGVIALAREFDRRRVAECGHLRFAEPGVRHGMELR